MRSFLGFLFFVGALLSVPRLAAAAREGFWDAPFTPSGVDREVLSVAPDGGNGLLVGGRFGGALRYPDFVVNYRDGQWIPLGSSIRPGVDGPVFCTAAMGTNVYFGGEFGTDQNGVYLNGLARWDGTAVHPLGSGPLAGINGYAYAMAVSGNDLIVAGRFRSAGGVSATNIARWNGSVWTSFGAGLGNGTSDNVSSLVVGPDGTLYAGGNFTKSGASTVRRIGRWDGAAWIPVGDGALGPVAALAWHQGHLIAGGSFSGLVSAAIPRLASWDGQKWSGLGSPPSDEVRCLMVRDDLLVVGGAFTQIGGVSASRIAEWSGTSWSAVGFGFSQGSVTAVNCLSMRGDRLVAGGDFTQSGPTQTRYLAEWNGAEWRSLDLSLREGESSPATAVLAMDGGVVVAGTFLHAGGLAAQRIARWDGTNWLAMGAGFDASPICLARGAGGRIYAGGAFRNPANCIARWNGSSWEALGAGIVPGGIVFAVAEAPNGDVYVGGIFTAAGGVDAVSIARWDGQSWSALGGGLTSLGRAGVVRALTFVGGTLYAGGAFDNGGGVPVNCLARWTGTAWEDVAGGVGSAVFSPAVFSLFPFEDGLLVSGLFSSVGAHPFANLAHVSLASGQWKQLGVPTDESVRSFDVLDGLLYAGGRFTKIGGINARGVARWDGTAWTPLKGGINDNGNGISAAGTNLWVVGELTAVEGKRTAPPVRWWLSASAPPDVVIASPVDGSEFPNGQTVHISLTASEAGGAALTVNLLGDDQPLAQWTTPPFEFDWQNVPVGSHQLRAVATDAQGLSVDSSTVRITVLPPGPLPEITQAPQGATVGAGVSLTLSVTATSPVPMTYRWLKDTVEIPGVTDPVLVLNPTTPEMSARYAAVVSNANGAVTSAPVLVTVLLEAKAYWTKSDDNGEYPTPSIGPGGFIYTRGQSGGVTCHDRAGTRIWSNASYTPSTQILVGADGSLYFGASGNGLVSLTSDGVFRWLKPLSGYLNGIATSADGRIYLTSDQGYLEARDGNGDKRWTHAVGFRVDAPPSLAKDGMIVFGADDGKMHAVRPDGTEAWTYDAGDLARTAAAIAADGSIIFAANKRIISLNPNGSPRWSYQASAAANPPSVGPDGSVYFGSNDPGGGPNPPSGLAICLSPAGTLRWASPLAGLTYGSPTLTLDGIAYFDSARELFALNPNGTRRWRYLAGGQVMGCAVGYDGTVYVADHGSGLQALAGTQRPPDAGWPTAGRDVRRRADASSPPNDYAWTFSIDDAGFDDEVSSIVRGGDGALYVSGKLTVAGGAPANHVARFDGQLWSDAGKGLNGEVRQVIWFGGKLYVRGIFQDTPGGTITRVVRRESGSWQAADQGLPGDNSTMEIHQGALYTAAIGNLGWYLYRYDGNKPWQAAGGLMPISPAYGLRSAPSGLYATGGNRVVRFDGADWSQVGLAFDNEVYDVIETPLGLFAAGGFPGLKYIARWDGTQWGEVGGGLSQFPEVFAGAFKLAAQGNNILVGGSFAAAGGAVGPNFARWDGTNWTSLLKNSYDPNGTIPLPLALLVEGDEICFGGSFLRFEGRSDLRYFAVFRDSAWTKVGIRTFVVDGALQLALPNFAGRPYRVEVSGDLRNWSTLFDYADLSTQVVLPIPPDKTGTLRFVRFVIP